MNFYLFHCIHELTQHKHIIYYSIKLVHVNYVRKKSNKEKKSIANENYQKNDNNDRFTYTIFDQISIFLISITKCKTSNIVVDLTTVIIHRKKKYAKVLI